MRQQLLVALAAGVSPAAADDLDLRKMEAALESPAPLFVKFEAPWCGHCKQLSPVWDALLGLDLDGARLGTVDCTRQEELRMRYGISSYPTLLLFVDGGARLFSGERSLPELAKFARGGWRKAPEHSVEPLPPEARGRKYKPPTNLMNTFETIRTPSSWRPFVQLAIGVICFSTLVQCLLGCYYFIFDRDALHKPPSKKKKKKQTDDGAQQQAQAQAAASAAEEQVVPPPPGKQHAD